LNPSFMKIHGIFNRNVAEILAEKQSVVPPADRKSAESQYRFMKDKVMDRQVLLESLDIIHSCPDEALMWDLLQRCTTEMAIIPKEAIFLAENLEINADAAFRARHGKELHELLGQLYLVRSGSREKI
jgi:hypothetical protein